jgi:hypothetical protein
VVAIVAAATVLIAGTVFLLTNDDPPVATPAPDATRLARSMLGVPIGPGAYFVDTDGDPATTPRATFVIADSGWEAMEAGARYSATDEILLMVTEIDYVGSPACGDGASLKAAGTSAEDLANQFAAAGFTVQEAVSPVNAFGRSGYHLLVEVPPGCDSSAHMAWRSPTFGGRYYHQGPNQMVEYWVLDVEGTPVTVEASWRAANTEEDLAPLRAAVDSLVITP